MPPSPDNTPEAVEAPLLARHLLAPRGGLNRRQRMLACIALSLAALTIGFAITAVLIQVEHGWQSGPGGRKGSAVALADGGTTLLVWSGRAKHATADLDPRVVHELDVGTGRWRAMWPATHHSSDISAGGTPAARWKSVSAPWRGGLILFGGDQQGPGHQDTYLDDLWRLHMHKPGHAVWEGEASGGAVPVPRRAAAGAIVDDDLLVIHGGRQRKKAQGLLDDVWAVRLAKGERWHKLWPANDDDDDNRSRHHAPAPRKGHVAVALPAGAVARHAGPSLFVYGGRNDSAAGQCYHADAAAFDVETRTWTRLHAGAPGQAPPPRDHGGAFYAPERRAVYVFGGRGGASYAASKPLNDVWRFDLSTREWTHVPIQQPWPSPRFLFGMDATASEDGGTRAVVFGGEGDGGRSFLDDAWEFSVATETWRPVTRGAVAAAG